MSSYALSGHYTNRQLGSVPEGAQWADRSPRSKVVTGDRLPQRLAFAVIGIASFALWAGIICILA